MAVADYGNRIESVNAGEIKSGPVTVAWLRFENAANPTNKLTATLVDASDVAIFDMPTEGKQGVFLPGPMTFPNGFKPPTSHRCVFQVLED